MAVIHHPVLGRTGEFPDAMARHMVARSGWEYVDEPADPDYTVHPDDPDTDSTDSTDTEEE